jgi:hypothetical protein
VDDFNTSSEEYAEEVDNDVPHVEHVGVEHDLPTTDSPIKDGFKNITGIGTPGFTKMNDANVQLTEFDHVNMLEEVATKNHRTTA